MSTSFVNPPDLTDEFVEQFHALERELAQLKHNTPVKPVVSADELNTLTSERDALKRERDSLKAERARLETERNELQTQGEVLSAERNEAISKQDEAKVQWGYAKARAEELERRLVELEQRLADVQRPGPETPAKPPADVDKLVQRIQSLEQERNNWMREYERCIDENEQLRRAGTGVVK